MGQSMSSMQLADAGVVKAVGERRVFVVLCVLLVGLFAMGGGSRADITSLVVVRPFAICALAFGLLSLRREHLRTHRWPACLALGAGLLILLHLAPLSPVVWQTLPGRAIIAGIDQAAGLDAQWRPLTLSPTATRDALWGLVPFLATFVLAVQLGPANRQRLTVVILLLGLGSAVLALLQLAGDPQGPLYLYAITNHGDAVGLFANRNHQALLLALLLPLLAIVGFAGRAEPVWRWLALTVALLVAALVLVTGSRLGLIAAAVATAAIPVLLAPLLPLTAKNGRLRARTYFLLGPILPVLALLTAITGRGEAVLRMMSSGSEAGFRQQSLPVVADMARQYWPWGSGLGTFEVAFRIGEPDRLLSPTYANHAHNDWAEVVMTGGLPAALLLALVSLWWLRRAAALIVRPVTTGDALMQARMGALIVAIFALASLVDYPLRVPAMGALLAIALVWMDERKSALPSHANAASEGAEKSERAGAS